MKANKIAEYLMDLLVSRSTSAGTAKVLDQLRTSGGSDMSEQARLVAAHANDDLLASQQAAVHQQLQSQADQLQAAQLHNAQLEAQALQSREVFVSQASAPVRTVYQPVQEHVTHNYVTPRNEYVTNNNNYRAGDTVLDNRTFTDIHAKGDVRFVQDVNNVTALNGGVAAGGDIRNAAVNTGTFRGVQAGNGPVDASHGVFGDHNTSVQDSHLGSLASNGGQAFNVPGNAVFGSGSLNDIHGPGQVAQGHSSITDVANHGQGNLNFGSGTLNDVDTHGSGPVSVDHSSANQVTASDHGQAVLGDGNKLTGDVSVDLHNNSGNANVAVGDHNGQAADQIDKSSHVTDGSTHDSNNTHTETDDHSNQSVNDSNNHKTIDDSFNHTTDSHDTHSVDGSYNHPTTVADSANHGTYDNHSVVDSANHPTYDSHNHTVDDSLNHPTYDSHDVSHTTDDSANHPTYDSHNLTHTTDDSFNHPSYDSHDWTKSVDDPYNHPSYDNHSYDSHDPNHPADDGHGHSWDLTHHA